MRTSKCTVEFLAMAAQGVYRLTRAQKTEEQKKEHRETLNNIENHGYQIHYSTPIGNLRALAVSCLTPQDPEKPIVISYRGTAKLRDVYSDARLFTTGVVEKDFRKDAYQYYEKIRAEFPGREIVLTGHSLGGHVAQYVGIKAYNQDKDLLTQPLVHVRTFNPAPIRSKHKSVFRTNPHISAQFINYRLARDVVSDIPLQNYYGNTFVFPTKHGILDSHKMHGMLSSLPPEVLYQSVGTTTGYSQGHNHLVELMNGILFSYQCRVEGQYFSRYRAGARNLQAMQHTFPELIRLLKNEKYDDALSSLKELKGTLRGKQSICFTNILIQATINTKFSEEDKGLESIKELFAEPSICSVQSIYL